MRTSRAARRYARALFSLAREERRVSELRTELDALADVVDASRELLTALLTPLHPASERKSVLDVLAQHIELSPTARRFCSFLIDRRRLVDLEGIREEYIRLAEEASGLVTAAVVSASPLDERRKDRLRRALSSRTGREVRLEISVDPDLIGGAVATVGDLVFDGSLRTQLSRLRVNLTKGS